MAELTYEENNTLGIHNVEPARKIIIKNPNGKKLNIDFSTDEVILTGELKYSVAAKQFFDALNLYFKEIIDNEVKKRLLELKKNNN